MNGEPIDEQAIKQITEQFRRSIAQEQAEMFRYFERKRKRRLCISFAGDVLFWLVLGCNAYVARVAYVHHTWNWANWIGVAALVIFPLAEIRIFRKRAAANREWKAANRKFLEGRDKILTAKIHVHGFHFDVEP